MKITRKHLNIILHNLPDPRLVERGVIAPSYKVPIIEPNGLIHDGSLPTFQNTKEINFEYSPKDMDWILEIKS